MSKSEEQSHSTLSAFDLIAEDLQRLRLDAGDVPYAEIVRRISSHRISQGVDPGGVSTSEINGVRCLSSWAYPTQRGTYF